MQEPADFDLRTQTSQMFGREGSSSALGVRGETQRPGMQS
jgi:hypothetical protein